MTNYEPIDKFNHGITFGKIASLGSCSEVCLPGKGNDESEEDIEGGKSVTVQTSVIARLYATNADLKY